MADSKVLKWYDELTPVELHVESAPSVDETVQLEEAEMVDDDAQYWAAFDDNSGIA